ncbi:hypothetical protein [Thermomonospora amylolytica]|uniref:hypothetical protein n=1 Tax=Thermomonospora amylolytica TaxID=1411117 RepID=UPI001F18CCD1|nr:hypothetical protein [Thermomonospora amylolytica]
MADLNGDQAERVVKEIAAAGEAAHAMVVDVADPESAQAVADTTAGMYGGHIVRL